MRPPNFCADAGDDADDEVHQAQECVDPGHHVDSCHDRLNHHGDGQNKHLSDQVKAMG